MHQNVPQSAPPGPRKGGPNPSKIVKKSSLGHPGCLQVTSRGCRPPTYTENRPTNYHFFTKNVRVWILARTPKLKNKKIAGVPPCILYLLGCRKSGRVQEKPKKCAKHQNDKITPKVSSGLPKRRPKSSKNHHKIVSEPPWAPTGDF